MDALLVSARFHAQGPTRTIHLRGYQEIAHRTPWSRAQAQANNWVGGGGLLWVASSAATSIGSFPPCGTLTLNHDICRHDAFISVCIHQARKLVSRHIV